MLKLKPIALLFAGLLLGSAVGFCAPLSEGNTCVSCHTDTYQELAPSVHGQHQILCNRCHGGDPSQTDMKLAKAKETGYLGIPDKKQIVQVCGECHANVEIMNPFGTRTDQLALYKTSHHGKALFDKADESVAACVDCHGYHEIMKVSDPASSVYPNNLPKTCAKCHANEKLMNKHSLPSDIFKNYESSVHGVALFEKQDMSVANCASCHGSHGAAPPGFKDISSTCGKCHANEKKFFLESPHARLAEKGEFSECVSCHSNHYVQKPTPALFEKACARCHEPETPGGQLSANLFQMLDESNHEQEKVESLIKQASIEGLFVEEEMALLEQLKTNVIELGPMQHTLSLDNIKALHEKIEATSAKIQKSLEDKRQSLKFRKMALVPIWIFILIMITALWIKYKQITHERERKK